MDQKLFIDLDICDSCKEECSVKCSYFYHQPYNDGVIHLREEATFAVTCRRCEEGACILSCPKEALSRGENGIVSRSGNLCIKCHSCVIACPFGTIMEDIISFLTSECDLCRNRLREGEQPLCVTTCTNNAVKYGDFSEDPAQRMYAVGDGVLVHVTSWKREEVKA